MSVTNENDPLNGAVEQEAQVPHSGVHFDERPVDEFDNTTLQEASEQGLIGPVPETIDPLVVTSEPTTPPKNTGRAKLYVGAGAGALALVAGAFFATHSGGEKTANQKPAATAAPNPEMEALKKQTQDFIDQTNQQSEEDTRLAEELANATPKYVTYDTQTHLQPTVEDVETLLWDVEIGVLRNDDTFLEAALGDDPRTKPDRLAVYEEAQRQVEDARQFGNVNLSNFYYGPRRDVANPIVQDERPWIFTVQIETRFHERVTYKTQLFTLIATENEAAGGMTWGIQTVTDIN